MYKLMLVEDEEDVREGIIQIRNVYLLIL
jgi:YesN/AraC family two-component response regulator